jgi:hypothetical protein
MFGVRGWCSQMIKMNNQSDSEVIKADIEGGRTSSGTIHIYIYIYMHVIYNGQRYSQNPKI